MTGVAKNRSKRFSQYYVYSAKEKRRGNDNNLEEQTDRHLKKFRDLGPRILRGRKQVFVQFLISKPNPENFNNLFFRN